MCIIKKVIDLDRKRNQNREALGKLRKDKNLKNGNYYIILKNLKFHINVFCY